MRNKKCTNEKVIHVEIWTKVWKPAGDITSLEEPIKVILRNQVSRNKIKGNVWILVEKKEEDNSLDDEYRH